MNPNNPHDSENNQPSFINPQDNDMLTVSSLEQETGNFRSNENANHVICAQTRNHNSQIQPVFFYRPPNHFYHYRVDCEKISYDDIEGLLNNRGNITQYRGDEYGFFYQQKCDNKFYRVSCEIAPPLLVNDCLNKSFLGIDSQNQNMEQETLTFTFDQKIDLEYHLRLYLSQHFLN